MKRKVIAMLLTVVMVLGGTGAAPLSGEDYNNAPVEEELPAAFSDGETAFGERPDEEATEDVQGNLDAAFTSEAPSGETFLDEPAFGDEQEHVKVEDVPIEMAGTGAGYVAHSSVYTEGASFGRQHVLKELQGCGKKSQNYAWYFGTPEETSYYKDGNGMLHIVSYDGEKKTLYDAAYAEGRVKNRVSIPMPLPRWGGFYAAPDGFFYVIVGDMNPTESTTKVVVKVMKYDRSWKLQGMTDIPGGISNMFPGIYIPFDASSLRMTMIDNILVAHTGREMFEMDGVHHQSDITFVINTENMSLVNTNIPYNSHSFNQFVLNDGNSVYYLDHGDAFERALVISKYDHSGNGRFYGDWSANVFPFMGEMGENFTGCEVTGFAREGNTLITIGKSLPHYFPVEGVTGWDGNMNRNVFMLLTDKNTAQTRFFWLTRFAPNGPKAEITEPKLVRISDNRYAILFSEETDNKSVLHYALIDAQGGLLLQKAFEGVTMQTDSQPFYMNHEIFWISGKYDNGAHWSDDTYLYKIPAVTVPLEKVSLDKDRISVKEGEKTKLSAIFEPANTDDVKDIVWKSSNPSVASVSAGGEVTAKGYGDAVISAVCGKLSATCNVSVQVEATDKPLSRPKLKTSQLNAAKIRLKWNKVPGAEGYQIYGRSSSKGRYKKLKEIKGTNLYCDMASVPGKTYSFKVRAYGTDKSGKAKYSSFSSVRTRKAEVPAPKTISCSFGSKAVDLEWSEVPGATGYAVYRNGKLVKKLSKKQLTWSDTEAYSADLEIYYVNDYYVRAFRKVSKKNIYGKPSKTVNLYNY